MKIKKIMATVLACAVIISSLAFGLLSAYAETVTITDAMIGIDIVKSTVGYDDNVWYVYTPSKTGIYTLYGLSDNLFATEAYLFEKTEDADGKKMYTQLAYSNSNPNYANYEGAAKRQFCLQYRLIEGVTYYYAAGWNSTSRSGSIAVRFINESYDDTEIVRVTPSCSAELTWYTDGSWETDDSGNAYYLYNPSKIIQNMTVTVEFADGTVLTSGVGDSTVGGYPITYTHRQSEVHWYNKENENYTANTLTVSVLSKSADYEVNINQSALLNVTGRVTDILDGASVENARIVIGSNTVATTKSDGTFTFAYSPGTYEVTVEGDSVLSRTFTLKVDAVNVSNNNHTEQPIGVVTVDYVNDGIINGRDYAYITGTLSGSSQKAAKSEFASYTGFEKTDYDALVL